MHALERDFELLPYRRGRKYSTRDFSLLRGILGQPQAVIAVPLVLVPSLIMIAGALIRLPLRGRSARLAPILLGVLSAVSVLLLGRQIPIALTISLWRPTELFGPGFVFVIDDTSWPLLLVGTAVVVADALRSSVPSSTLLVAGAALAAIMAGSLLSLVMMWTIMISIQAAIELRKAEHVDTVLRRLAIQGAALIAVLTAATYDELAALFVGLAVLLRAVGGSTHRLPLTMSVLTGLTALAAFGHPPDPIPAIASAAGIALLVGLIRSAMEPSNTRNVSLAISSAAILTAVLVPQSTTVVVVGGSVSLVLSIAILAFGIGKSPWVAVLAISALTLGISGSPESLVPLTIASALLAAIIWNQSITSTTRVTSLEVGGLLVVIGAAVLALTSSGWAPDTGPLISTTVGIGLGYLLSRALAALEFRYREIFGSTGGFGLVVLDAISLGIRTTTGILEGRSAVLWILLVLLLAVIGLQTFAP